MLSTKFIVLNLKAPRSFRLLSSSQESFKKLNLVNEQYDMHIPPGARHHHYAWTKQKLIDKPINPTSTASLNDNNSKTPDHDYMTDDPTYNKLWGG